MAWSNRTRKLSFPRFSSVVFFLSPTGVSAREAPQIPTHLPEKPNPQILSIPLNPRPEPETSIISIPQEPIFLGETPRKPAPFPWWWHSEYMTPIASLVKIAVSGFPAPKKSKNCSFLLNTEVQDMASPRKWRTSRFVELKLRNRSMEAVWSRAREGGWMALWCHRGKFPFAFFFFLIKF